MTISNMISCYALVQVGDIQPGDGFIHKGRLFMMSYPIVENGQVKVTELERGSWCFLDPTERVLPVEVEVRLKEQGR